MGLDISFNRDLAIAAGLKLTRTTNGEANSIDEAQRIGVDPEYLDWLQREAELVHIPGTNLVTDNDGLDSIVIRANKWGQIYRPMTTWLKANNIEWSEF